MALIKKNIAVLSSYTAQNIKTSLMDSLNKRSISSTVTFGGFNQHIQELIDSQSWLYKKNVDFVIVLISTQSYLGDILFDIAIKGFKKTLKNALEKTILLIKAIKETSLSCPIYISTFEHVFSPFLTELQDNKSFKIIEECNHLLTKFAQEEFGITLFSVEDVVSSKPITNDQLYYLGKMFLSNEAAKEVGHYLGTCIAASLGQICKCIIVDLDNTLWKGVIGEDGKDGVALGESATATIFKDIQKILKIYKENGVLLAIVSKNNEGDVLSVFDSIDGMILKKDDFITHRINWDLKSQNIKSIAEELNLGISSFLFIDDNPAERFEVKEALPPINILDFPSDIAKLPRILKTHSFLQLFKVTAEDKKRNQMYQQDKKRKDMSFSRGSLKDYLKRLEINIKVYKDDISTLERTTQLINKTNQFNLRTKRYTQEEVKYMIESKDFRVYTLKVWDKFGEMGLTGVLILKRCSTYFFINSFLLSCRILSRDIEFQFLNEIFKELDNSSLIKAEYLKTLKNSQVQSFYDDLGFKVTENQGKLKMYTGLIKDLNLKDKPWINVKNE